MSSAPRIVPSRSALRALRRLAYGGSTVIGAVGSVFTVAGVSYDTQRRVRLAERLVETKRTIKSVSNSNGAAHVARMFEAAEKGEDFGLDTTGPRRRSINRAYSALATESAQQCSLAGGGPFASHHPLRKDDKGDREQVGKVPFSRKQPLRPLRGPTAPHSRLLSSHGLAKELLPNPIFHQRQFFQEPGWQNTTYSDPSEPCGCAQAVTELLPTGAPDAGRILVRKYPIMRNMVDSKAPSSARPRSSVPRAPRPNREFDSSPREENSTVQRIAVSTRRQQHKPDGCGAYLRPGRGHVAKRVRADVSPYERNGAKTNSSAAEKIVAATQQQHKLQSHTVYGRPGKANVEVHARLNDNVALWLSGAEVSGDNVRLERNSGRQAGFSVRGRSNSKRPGPASPAGTRLGGTPSHQQKDSQEFSFSSSKKQVTAAPGNEPLQSDRRDVSSSRQSAPSVVLDLQLKPRALSASPSADIPETSAMDSVLPQYSRPEVTQMQQNELSPSNDLSDQSPPRYEQNPKLQQDHSQCKSDATLCFDEVFEQVVQASKTGGYPVWQYDIHTSIEKHGMPAARQFWLHAMAYYATPGHTLDWKMVDALHMHFHEMFWTAKSPYFDFYPARLLTRHFLQTDPTSQRAAELLFPLSGKEMELEAEYAAKGMVYHAKQRSRNMFANASKYLQDFWDEGHDAGKVISELRKVIRVAKMHDIELAEDLFFGTIRRLSSDGQVEQAQALFDEMAYYHSIEPSFLTRSVLVCGHARSGDWERVAKDIEAMHNVHDLSRREPIGYSLMFNDVLVEYASRRSIAQTHDFLVHALGYWGLVPTSAISATAIEAFLTHRRYDLVREWIETVRVLFPQVDTETSRFAWHLGSVFEDISASCVEVEEACKALCYRKDASKVQASTREMVRLALARDLATKLHAAEAAEAGSQKEDTFPASSPWALDHFLERAQSFVPNPSAGGESQSAQSQEARELLSQVESVTRLNKLFGTQGNCTDPPSTNVNESSPPRILENRTAPAQTAPLQSNVPTELMRDLLPTLPGVERLLNQHYTSRQDAGLPISHAVLKYTCQKLRKHDRRVDAMQLLKTIFDGPYVQTPTGVMFDLSIMEMWLRCAYETKSLSHCLAVFWAVLDAGEDYLLTSKFVLLANMSYHKVQKNRFETLAVSNPSKHKELEYLLERLRRRLWENKEGSGPKGDKTRAAEHRKMKHQMRRRLVLGTPRPVEVTG